MDGPMTQDRLEKYIGLEAEIEYLMDGNGSKDRISALQKEKKAIENTIFALADPMERLVMCLRYLENDGERRRLTWAVVAAQVYGTDEEKYRKAAQRLHNSALEHLAMVDAEKEKSHR